MATTRTSHSSTAGCSIGSGGFARGAFCNTLTNRPTSFPAGALANQSPRASASTSRAGRIISSGLNGNRRRISSRNFVWLTFSRTTNVPAAPMLTKPNCSSSFASLPGWNFWCPPTLTALKKTTDDMVLGDGMRPAAGCRHCSSEKTSAGCVSTLLDCPRDDAQRAAAAALDLHRQRDDVRASRRQLVERGHVLERWDVVLEQDAMTLEQR